MGVTWGSHGGDVGVTWGSRGTLGVEWGRANVGCTGGCGGWVRGRCAGGRGRPARGARGRGRAVCVGARE
eukprot:1359140-Prymnesium_polylepis.1